jgi:hypothetical protein
MPGNRGFTLRCVLQAVDPGPDTVVFTFRYPKYFQASADILAPDAVFQDVVSMAILNEDRNGPDEIRAVYTLVNNTNGTRVVRRGGTHTIAL